MRTFGLFLWVSAFAISSCKTQHTVTTERDTVVITERVAVVDTVTIEKDRLRVRLLRLPGDTVRVEAECQPDTVRIQTTKVEYNTEKLETQRKWTASLFLLALVLFILVLLKK